jgi:hypothetical protein
MNNLLPVLLLGGAAWWFLSQKKKQPEKKPAEFWAQQTVAPKSKTEEGTESD